MSSTAPREENATVQGNLSKPADYELHSYSRQINSGMTIGYRNDKERAMAFMTACWEGHLDVVTSLLETHVPFDGQNYDGDTALMNASVWGHDDIIKALLAWNANVDIQNKYGSTALMKACENGQITCVRLLLEKNPNLNMKNIKGETAKDLAETRGYKSIIDILVESESKKREPTLPQSMIEHPPELLRNKIKDENLGTQREIFKQSKVIYSQDIFSFQEFKMKTLEEENERLRAENSDIKKENVLLTACEAALRVENRFLKESEIKSLQNEIIRLNSELIAQEQRYERRREEDLRVENQRREEERRSNQEMVHMMITTIMNSEGKRRRKVDDQPDKKWA